MKLKRSEQLKAVSETYFQGLRDKSFSTIPFSNDIVFRAPLAPGGSQYPIRGKLALYELWWKPLEPAMEGVAIDIVDHYLNESQSEVLTKANITIGLLGTTFRTVDRFVVNDKGEITEQENHFDASPMKSYIHHICLRSTNFDITKKFYGGILGFPLAIDMQDLIIFVAGSVFLAFKLAQPRNKEFSTFSPFEVGLDHIAITCEREEELHAFAKKLADAGVENTGVKMDPVLNKLYLAFKDPDRISWEFYMK